MKSWKFVGLTILIFLILPVQAQEVELKYEVVFNRSGNLGESKIKERNVYVFIPENSFSVTNVTKILDEIRRRNCTPFDLTIAIYTDRNELQRLIRYDTKGPWVDFPDTPEGRIAASKFYKRAYPAQQGYFRVQYYRYAAYEFFDYTQAKDSPETKRVQFKDLSPNAPCKGES